MSSLESLPLGEGVLVQKKLLADRAVVSIFQTQLRARTLDSQKPKPPVIPVPPDFITKFLGASPDESRILLEEHPEWATQLRYRLGQLFVNQKANIPSKFRQEDNIAEGERRQLEEQIDKVRELSFQRGANGSEEYSKEIEMSDMTIEEANNSYRTKLGATTIAATKQRMLDREEDDSIWVDKLTISDMEEDMQIYCRFDYEDRYQLEIEFGQRERMAEYDSSLRPLSEMTTDELAIIDYVLAKSIDAAS